MTGAGVHGPISQNEFLHRLGIRQRIEVYNFTTVKEMAPPIIKYNNRH